MDLLQKIIDEKKTYTRTSDDIVKAIHKSLFSHQRNFIDDKSTHKTALCSRRAGKSYTFCAYLIETALKHPGTISVYIALTRLTAKRIMWAELKRFNDRFNIGIQFNGSELTCRLPNGSEVWLTGASDEADIEKLRGPKYKLVGIDECASFGRYFDSLVEDVIEYALIDLRGTLCLAGTPGAACAGLFYRATTEVNSGWTNHHWTILDNPHIPHAKEYLDEKRAKRNWKEDHPTYVREWLGRWSKSLDSLVYKFNNGINSYDAEESTTDLLGVHEFVLGVDLGTRDEFAISVLAFSKETKSVAVVDGFSQSGLIPDQWEEKIRAFQDKYSPIATVADAGALGRAIVDNFKSHGVFIKAAEKQKKAAYIELLNGELIAGKMKVRCDLKVCDEMSILQWDPDKEGKEDERFANNNCDAMLYAWRECYHYLSLEEPELPPIATEDYYKMEAKSAKEKRFREVSKRGKAPDEFTYSWEETE